jgi:hypothetical protein
MVWWSCGVCRIGDQGLLPSLVHNFNLINLRASSTVIKEKLIQQKYKKLLSNEKSRKTKDEGTYTIQYGMRP